MNKAIKAQWGVVVPRVLPIIGQFIESLPSLAAAAGIAGSFVDAKVNDHSDSKKQLRQQVAQLAQQRRHQMAVAAARNFTAPTLNNTQSSDATRITRPVVVSTARPTTLNLHRAATTKAHPIAITRTMSAANDSTGTAPRDTTGTAASAARGTDNRSFREKLGDRIAGRGRQKSQQNTQQNQNTENPENNNQNRNWGKAKKVGKGIVGAVVANEVDNKFGSPVKNFVINSFQQLKSKPDTVYVNKPTQNSPVQQKYYGADEIISVPNNNSY